MAGRTPRQALAMELVAPTADNARHMAQLVDHLQKECVKIPVVPALKPDSSTSPAVGQTTFAVACGCEESTAAVYWNARLGFWFCYRDLDGDQSLAFGLDNPRECVRVRSLYALTIFASGCDCTAGGALVRFGNDVFLAHTGQSGEGKIVVDGTRFLSFVAVHGYDLVQASVKLSANRQVDIVLLSSTSDSNAGLNIYKFLSAVRDFEQWRAWNLLMPQADTQPTGASLPPVKGCHGQANAPLHAMVVESLGEQLEASIRVRNVAYTLGKSAQHDILAMAPDGSVAAVFQVKTDITPPSLFCGAGELLLSRATFQAKKVLLVPQNIGPFFTQALHRQGIEVATYMFAGKGIVFIDIDRVLESLANTL